MHGFRVLSCSVLSDSATPWTAACQVPLSMILSQQAYWSGLPFPSPGDLPDPGIKSGSPALQADSLPSEPPGKPVAFTLLLINQIIEMCGACRENTGGAMCSLSNLELHGSFPRSIDNGRVLSFQYCLSGAGWGKKVKEREAKAVCSW